MQGKILPAAIPLLILCGFLCGCTQTQAMRTSGNTMLIQTSALPSCTMEQTTQVAQKMAAVETIRAGYDRFIIMDSDLQNNVTEETLPGSYRHSGTMTGYGSMAMYSGTSHYTPGPTVQQGSYNASFHIQMFHESDKAAYNAMPARALLGPDWQSAVTDGINSCL